jgi:hypothetical protein
MFQAKRCSKTSFGKQGSNWQSSQDNLDLAVGLELEEGCPVTKRLSRLLLLFEQLLRRDRTNRFCF